VSFAVSLHAFSLLCFLLLQVVDYLVDPFVAGTSGADPDSISVHHSFPDLWALEERLVFLNSLTCGEEHMKFF
jgi:hypothetical protein